MAYAVRPRHGLRVATGYRACLVAHCRALCGSLVMGFLRLGMISILLSTALMSDSGSRDTGQRFTVADEIGLTLFGALGGIPSEVLFSPDGSYFAVWSER